MVWKRHSPGDKDRGCEITEPGNCRKSCCRQSPPEQVTIELWPEDCTDCDTGTLTFEDTANPDGHNGMWKGTVTVHCGGGCDPEQVEIKWWCNLECDPCDCDCELWSFSIDDGPIQRVSANPGTLVEHCCCDGFLRSWALVTDLEAGSGNCTGHEFCARVAWGTGCMELVNTAGCVSPIGKTMNLFVEGPCGTHTFQIEAPAASYDCEEDVEWTGSGTVQCQATEGGSCVDVTMTVTLRLTASTCPADKVSDNTEWEWEVDIDCSTGNTHIVATVQCPTCTTSQFSTNPAQAVVTSLICPAGTCNSTQNNFSIWAEDACFQNNSCGLGRQVQFIAVDPEHPEWGCGHGLLSFEPTEENHCDCSGRWYGLVTMRCEDPVTGELTADVLEVEICDSCNDCDREACGWQHYSIKIDDGPAKTAEKGCCDDSTIVGRFRGHVFFGNVTVGPTSGSCGGREIAVNVGWHENMMLATTGAEPLLPVSSHWTLSYTDPSGTSRVASLSGRLTCDDTQYYNWFRNRRAATWDCGDGNVYLVYFNLRQLHFLPGNDKWHLTMEVPGFDPIFGIFTPNDDITWAPCTPSAPHSAAGIFSHVDVGKFCLGGVDIAWTLLEVQSSD